jgi:hypothetical protein
MKPNNTTTQITIQELSFGQYRVGIIGTKPLLMHRFSDKARRELLLPRAKMNQVEKETTLKHDSPVQEAKDAAIISRYPDSPAFFGMPAGAIKGGLATAALRMPGVKKTEIGQLAFVLTDNDDNLIPIYGIPKLHMSMVRNSGMNRTPDVRSRLIFPVWAAEFTVRYIKPNLTELAIARMLHAAGMICGLGDWRAEKGKGDYGSYEVVDETIADRFEQIRETAGRVAQEAAYNDLQAYDAETAELVDWYHNEVEARGRERAEVQGGRRKAKAGNGVAHDGLHA